MSKQHKSKRHYCELLRENLVSLCGIPPSLSGSLTTALNSYFRSHQLVFPANPLTLKEFAHCFKTEYRGPDLLLSKDLPAGSDVEDKQDGKGRRLVLRFHPKLEGSLLARLGFFLFEVCCWSSASYCHYTIPVPFSLLHTIHHSPSYPP